ncbi:hypothetical protein GC169_00510 [bacterium]|nr:hypothetical protein [bacterium]
MASMRGLSAVIAMMLLAVQPVAAQSVGERVEVGSLALEALPAQSMKSGVCGLFLWSKTERPVFILFATERPGEAKIKVDGRERRLPLTLTGGAQVSGHFERQTFSDRGMSLELDLAFDLDRPMQDGAVLKRGVLKSRDSNGFESIVPVGGMIGCQTGATADR